MKLTIGQEEFITGLQAVQNVVSTRTTLPILSNVLLNAVGDRLTLTATDLDVTISKTVESKVEIDGSFTMPVKKLLSIAREVGGSQIEMDVSKNQCSIKSGSSAYRVNGLPAEEFPPIPNFSGQTTIQMPQDTVKTMLRRTSFAVSTDENRYVLNGLYLSFKENKLTMVATDGRRLALAEEDVELKDDNPLEVIVPTKAIQELSRSLGDKGDVEIQITENQVSFGLKENDGTGSLIVSKLVEGAYPNYKQVIPAESKHRVTLDKEELFHALRRAEIMTSEKANSVKLTFSENNLTFTANSPEVGESRETMAIKYEGEETSISFNPQFFIDPLKALEEDEVHFEFTDQLSPGVVKVKHPFLYVIMPMRTS
ncbi:DNA polymerase III subunit beta [Verrucomicrobia bacterium]|nr:DNA polymerase III subunit beta [Verrucomicrobiota bacterium]